MFLDNILLTMKVGEIIKITKVIAKLYYLRKKYRNNLQNIKTNFLNVRGH